MAGHAHRGSPLLFGTLIHRRRLAKRCPALGQNSIGRVGQNSVGANRPMLETKGWSGDLAIAHRNFMLLLLCSCIWRVIARELHGRPKLVGRFLGRSGKTKFPSWRCQGHIEVMSDPEIAIARIRKRHSKRSTTNRERVCSISESGIHTLKIIHVRRIWTSML